MVQINWTLRAIGDLKNIADYISKDSVKYAKLHVVRIKLQTRILKKYSRVGRIVPEYNNPDLREIIYGNYRIIYKIISENRIDIITLHHSAKKL